MTRLASLPLLALAAVLAACGAPPPAAAPAPAAPAPAAADSGVLAIQQGGNDVFVERFTRAPGRLDTHLTALGINVRIEAALAPDASVSRMVVRQYAAATDTVPAVVLTADFRGDSVFAEMTGVPGGPRTIRQQVGAGAVPYVNPSPALIEQIALRARAMGRDTAQVPLWIAAGAGQPSTSTVIFEPGVARVSIGPVEVRLDVDAQGRATGGAIPQQGLGIVRRAVGAGPETHQNHLGDHQH